MADSQPQFQALDQLQNEVNRILEQTGRIFAAVNDNPKVLPVAQATKLKKDIPVVNERFHEALDQLEDELQLAKLVMRRDLALCREQAGVHNPAQTNGTALVEESRGDKAAVTPPQADTEVLEASADVEMPDAQETKPAAVEGAQTLESETSEQVSKRDDDVTATEAATNAISQEEPPADEKPADQTLHIDTKPPPKADTAEEQPVDEDQPPDTGTFSNTNDLDSLFGPTSADPAGDGADFSIDPDNSAEFDFETFAGASLNDNNSVADNDNISALLPGLQDYANTHPVSGNGGEDFDALFDTSDLPMQIDGQGDGEQQGPPQGHRDSTFDDLLDFADFNAGDFAAGEAGNGDENQDFDFNFDA